MQINIVQDGVAIAVSMVLEHDVVEVDRTVLDRFQRLFGVRQRRLLVQHFHDTPGRRCGHGQHDENHRQHHQVHQHVHDVGEHGGQVAHIKRTARDQRRAQPAQRHHRAVDGQHHDGTVESDDAFRLDEQVVDVRRRFAELLVLEVLTHKRFDDADAGDVLLHGGVQVVVLLEHLIEQVRRALDNQPQHNAQQHQRNQEHARQLRVDEECRDHRENQRQQRTNRNARNHLEGILNVGHVGGHARDQTGGGVFVDVGEREALDVAVHAIAQVRGKAGGGVGRRVCADGAENQRQHCHRHHQEAIAVNRAGVAALNAILHQARHRHGNQHFHDDFQRGKNRRENR